MLRGEGEGGITFESIHGQDTAVIRAADLDIDRFLPARAETPRSAPASAADLPAAPTKVLLTGANGFLGRFLLLGLLQRVSEQCARARPPRGGRRRPAGGGRVGPPPPPPRGRGSAPKIASSMSVMHYCGAAAMRDALF